MSEETIYVCANRSHAILMYAWLGKQQSNDLVSYPVTAGGSCAYVFAVGDDIFTYPPVGEFRFRPAPLILLEIQMRAKHPFGLYWVPGEGYSPEKSDASHPRKFTVKLSYEDLWRYGPEWALEEIRL